MNYETFENSEICSLQWCTGCLCLGLEGRNGGMCTYETYYSVHATYLFTEDPRTFNSAELPFH